MTLFLAALAVLPLAGARAQSQMALDETANREFERADARLNIVYRQVLGMLDATGRKKLQKAERAWVAYRDAQADLEADVNRGGTMEPMVYSSTETDLTDARIKALHDFQADMNDR